MRICKEVLRFPRYFKFRRISGQMKIDRSLFQFFVAFIRKFDHFLSRFVPKSVRWLLSRNRVEEANEIIHRAAKINGVDLPQKCSVVQEKTTTAGIKAIFRARTLLCRSLIMFANW